MGFLGTSAPLQSDLSLIIQLIVLVMILISVKTVRKQGYIKHAYLMLAALTATLWSALIVMVPVTRSLIRMYRPYGLSILVRVHMTFGAIVFLLGLYLMGVWRLNEPGPCFRHKGKMKALTWLWVGQVLGGIAIYYMIYA